MWLCQHNNYESIAHDAEPFIDALNKTRKQYYHNEIDILKDTVSIPGISMSYMLLKQVIKFGSLK